MRKIAFLSAVCTALFVFNAWAQPTIQIPFYGAFGYYPLGDTPQDISGQNNHGQLIGNVEKAPDRGGKACATRTITQNGTIALPFSGFGINGDSAITLSFWVQFGNCTNGHVLLTGDTSAELFSIGCVPGITGGWMPSMGLAVAQPTAPKDSFSLYTNRVTYAPQTWYHMVVVARQNVFQWYVNNDLVYHGPSKQPLMGIDGIEFSADSTVFDDVNIFNLAFSEGQITDLYQRVTMCDQTTALSTGDNAQEQFRLHPNPSSQGDFSVIAPGTVSEVTVRELSGNIVFKSTLPYGRGLKPGSYIVEVKTEAVSFTRKLIVTN